MKVIVKPYASLLRELITSQIFNYTGSIQYLIIPEECHLARLKLWSGGGGRGGYGNLGGTSAFVNGYLSVIPGDMLSIYVGHAGVSSADAYVSGQGGGASAVLLNGTLVAAVGAGAGGDNHFYTTPNIVSKHGRLLGTTFFLEAANGAPGDNACGVPGIFGYGVGGAGGNRCNPYGYGVGGGGGGGYKGGSPAQGGLSYYQNLFNIQAEVGGTLPGGSTDPDKLASIGTENQPGQVVVKLFKIAEVAEVDPYSANVVLLMHMDGVDNGTMFIEETGKTASPENVSTITSNSKFGLSSMGVRSVSNIYSGLRIPASQDFVFSGDFTIEAWIYPTSTVDWGYGGPTVVAFSSGGGAATIAAVGLTLATGVNAGKLAFGAIGHTSSDILLMAANPLTLNQWQHVAVSRQGTTSRLFINGEVVAVDTSSSSIVGNAAWICSIGSLHYTDGQRPFRGQIDEVRITKGVARYTANFSVPTTQFNL